MILVWLVCNNVMVVIIVIKIVDCLLTESMCVTNCFAIIAD